jgi:hypothetical protein
MERREAHGQRSVMGLVIRRLYFGKATRAAIGMNGRILRAVYDRGFSWEAVARVVEGLAIRRDRGELYGVRPCDPVSLRWVIDKSQPLDQVAVCLDAFYREIPKPVEKKLAGMNTMSSLLSQYAKGA